MIGLGTVVNAVGIVVGGVIGTNIGHCIKDKYKERIMQCMGLCVVLLGTQMALQTEKMLIVLGSMVLGTIMGEVLRIEDRLEQLGARFRSLVAHNKGVADNRFIEGFVITTILYCIGAMAILGPIEDGFGKTPMILYTKSILDTISSIIYGSIYGRGVAFSSIMVALYQGLITILAVVIQPYLTASVMNEITAVGGLLVLGIGINILGMAKLHVANMIFTMLIAGILAYYF